MADGNDFAGPSVGAFENDQMQGHVHTENVSGASSGGTLGIQGVANYASIAN